MDGYLTGPNKLGAVRVIKVAALLFAGSFLADTAQAQVLAFNEPSVAAFGQANMPGRGLATDTTARLRRQVVNFATRKRPARSSSIRRTPISTSCSAAARRSATASASAAKASPGPASRPSSASPNGRTGMPPAEMLARQPYLPRFMAGGPGNPLGARAMYLGGTVYRIHGTNEAGHHRQARVQRLHPHAQ